jgi:hypothetical protein
MSPPWSGCKSRDVTLSMKSLNTDTEDAIEAAAQVDVNVACAMDVSQYRQRSRLVKTSVAGPMCDAQAGVVPGQHTWHKTVKYGVTLHLQ